MKATIKRLERMAKKLQKEKEAEEVSIAIIANWGDHPRKAKPGEKVLRAIWGPRHEGDDSEA